MIKNLLFDLGGVIMDIRRENCVDAMRALGFEDVSRYLGDYGQSGIFYQIEAGLISPGEFRRELRRHFTRPVTDEEIDEAFCKFLVGIPVHRLHALERLKSNYCVLMLSNTNPIMWHSEIDRQFRQDGGDMNRYFHGTVTSFEAKTCKPDSAIFAYVAEKFGIHPEETLFFDDSEENCEAARRCGYQTVHVVPGTEFIDLLPQ